MTHLHTLYIRDSDGKQTATLSIVATAGFHPALYHQGGRSSDAALTVFSGQREIVVPTTATTLDIGGIMAVSTTQHSLRGVLKSLL